MTRFKKTAGIGAAIIVAGLAAQTLHAQAIPRQLEVLVEQLDSDAAACGITEQGLVSAASAGMRKAGTQPVSRSTPWLYVRITTLSLDTGCSSNYEVAVREPHYKSNGQGAVIDGIFETCRKGGIIAGSNHARRIYSSVEEATAACLSSIRTAN